MKAKKSILRITRILFSTALAIVFALSIFGCVEKNIRRYADAKKLDFGVAVRPSDMLYPERAELLADHFNILVAENTMKMQYLRPNPTFWNWSDIDQLINFAEEHKMKIKGHTFIWHSQNSGFVSSLNTREDALKVLRETITETLTRYKGRIAEYDICNEIFEENGTLRDSVWMRTIGPEYVDIAFQTAREADPSVKLLLNDYNNEYAGTAKADAFYNLVKYMVERGIPIDGVGFQMHMIAKDPIKEAALLANIRRFNDLGLTVSFTEVDVRIQMPVTPEKEAQQEAAYKTLLRIAMEEPNVKSFILWGYTDLQSWIPATFGGYGSAHLFDDKFQPKPVYHTLMDMIKAK